jgi:hypothetical protein
MRGLGAIAATAALVLGCNDRPAAPATGKPSARVEVASVTWPGAPPDPTAVARLPRPMRALVDTSPLPVLVPPDEALLAAGSLIVEPSYYAFHARTGGATVNVHATRPALQYDAVPAQTGARALRATRGFVTQNEGIYSASWTENGVAYSVDVECESFKDARCASDAYVISLANGLAYVGGKP